MILLDNQLSLLRMEMKTVSILSVPEFWNFVNWSCGEIVSVSCWIFFSNNAFVRFVMCRDNVPTLCWTQTWTMSFKFESSHGWGFRFQVQVQDSSLQNLSSSFKFRVSVSQVWNAKKCRFSTKIWFWRSSLVQIQKVQFNFRFRCTVSP